MAHLLQEFFIARHGQLALGGMDKAGALALGRITVECEVGHDEGRVAKLHGAAVQLAVFVLKNTQMGTFFGQLGHDGAIVGVPHAQQDDQTRPDFARLTAVDGDAGMGNALDDGSHNCFLSFSSH